MVMFINIQCVSVFNSVGPVHEIDFYIKRNKPIILFMPADVFYFSVITEQFLLK